MPMSPCPTCARHVRVDDGPCPFCGSDAGRPPAKVPRRSAQRVTRAALFFAGVLGASACGADDDPGGADIYGGPPATVGQDDPEAVSDDPRTDPQDEDLGADEAMPVEAYGAPPPPPDDAP